MLVGHAAAGGLDVIGLDVLNVESPLTLAIDETPVVDKNRVMDEGLDLVILTHRRKCNREVAISRPRSVRMGYLTARACRVRAAARRAAARLYCC
ncbi:hypothetical protein EVAR_98448_1 [Eumeta japonica]|uniref:Uncharacterized protein n=1 Tax=Eumeta variegata TaxID=151549 RepID=A0A4C1YTY4_EUMVA|nr:hypothetical protein EVAR_98448_1 [Eumeta japonica]